MIQTAEHRYGAGALDMVGMVAWDEASADPRPGILIAPAFGGISEFERAKARELAAMGCVALAVDYYGDGRRAQDGDEAARWMADLMAKRPVLAVRMAAALASLKTLPMVDAARTGAMGYCLGGKAVLDLARSGATIEAVVSLHGVYDPPPDRADKYHPAILLLHGWDDPLASPEALASLAQELTQHCADWQVLGFGHAGHAFTNPNASDPESGMAFNAVADRRAWQALTAFFAENLGPSA